MSKVTYNHGSIGVNDRPNGLGTSPTILAHYGMENLVVQPTNGSDHDLPTADKGLNAALSHHIAVTNHGKGVGSENLANFIECFGTFAAGRVLTTGRLQYELGDTGEQRFEGLTPEQLCDELVDELLDVINYASMIGIKVLAIRKAL